MNSFWSDLQWSPWAAFNNPETFQVLPRLPGMYRVRPVGRDELAYIGQTGVDLRNRLNALRRGTMADQMPFNDPHTAAPLLWALRDGDGYSFECSAAPADLPKPDREALECFLLWQYRLEQGQSTLGNHGRHHSRYTKSADRRSGRRGSKIADGLPDNPAGGPSMPPLHPTGNPTSPDWMGLPWTDPEPLSPTAPCTVRAEPGIYRLLSKVDQEVVYIGESENLRSRLVGHARRDWGGPTLLSVCYLPQLNLAYQRHEYENDLIGAFWSHHKRAPRFQFVGHSGK